MVSSDTTALLPRPTSKLQLVRCDIYIFTDLAIICTEITSQLVYPKNNLKLACLESNIKTLSEDTMSNIQAPVIDTLKKKKSNRIGLLEL